MRFGEPLYLYLIVLIPLLIGFLIWAEKKRKALSAQFVDASLLSRLVSAKAEGQRRRKTRLLIWGLVLADGASSRSSLINYPLLSRLPASHAIRRC